MQKKYNNNSFDFTDKNQIGELSENLKEIVKKYPIFNSFLESFCGYNTPLLSSNPNEICYAQGKRDVVLTIKTIMRDDISPDTIAKFYKSI